MFIAHKLKRENICEYLLYMWQIEDLIRAFDLNMEAINQRIVSTFPVKDENERKSLYEWYESLVELTQYLDFPGKFQREYPKCEIGW